MNSNSKEQGIRAEPPAAADQRIQQRPSAPDRHSIGFSENDHSCKGQGTDSLTTGLPWTRILLWALLGACLMLWLFCVEVSGATVQRVTSSTPPSSFGNAVWHDPYHGPIFPPLPSPTPMLSVSFRLTGTELYAASGPRKDIEQESWLWRLAFAMVGATIGGVSSAARARRRQQRARIRDLLPEDGPLFKLKGSAANTDIQPAEDWPPDIRPPNAFNEP